MDSVEVRHPTLINETGWFCTQNITVNLKGKAQKAQKSLILTK